MKALTLWQPWASLMALGHKKVETRCWTTKYRGLVAIHAAKHNPQAWLGVSRFTKGFQHYLGMCIPKPEDLPYGAVVAIGNLVHIDQTETVREDLSEQELWFGNYEEGRYAWFFENIRPIEPVFVKGNRLLWNLNDASLNPKTPAGQKTQATPPRPARPQSIR